MNKTPLKMISEHYQNLFGEKVYKIPLTLSESCPNREGLKGMETCIFCDEWGSAARSEAFSLDLHQQIEKYQRHIKNKFKARSFLAYFQAYTNTFTKISNLRNAFEIALSYSWMKGLVIGTRPDCISKGVIELWQEYHKKSFVAVELGVQSFFDDQLLFLKRGHNSQQSIQAIHQINSQSQVDLGIHLIFGLPNETDDHIIQTAKTVNILPITNIKLHNLHVLKNTPLEMLYKNNQFNPIDRETYAQKVELFLSYLSPHIFVHRLSAYAPRWDELIAPDWTADKMGTHQFILDFINAKKSYQSKNLILEDPLKLSQQKALQEISFMEF